MVLKGEAPNWEWALNAGDSANAAKRAGYDLGRPMDGRKQRFLFWSVHHFGWEGLESVGLKVGNHP